MCASLWIADHFKISNIFFAIFSRLDGSETKTNGRQWINGQLFETECKKLQTAHTIKYSLQNANRKKNEFL